jgi:hypothetical protein
MSYCNYLIIYDQWSYVTMLVTLDMVCTALREGIQIDRLLFAESPEEQAIWQVNRPLPVYLQMVVEDRVFVLDILVRVTKQLDPTCLRLLNTQFSYAGAQGAAVEPQNFGSPIFATHFPIGLLKYPDHMVAFDFFQRFLGGR